jgi:hypothetical protein
MVHDGTTCDYDSISRRRGGFRVPVLHPEAARPHDPVCTPGGLQWKIFASMISPLS